VFINTGSYWISKSSAGVESDHHQLHSILGSYEELTVK